LLAIWPDGAHGRRRLHGSVSRVVCA
jgi:hypothetical protein